MSYVDGFVIPVPKSAKDRFRAFATEMAIVFKSHGALEIIEAWGDDVPPGALTSFPMAVQLNEDEVVVFAWIRWSSRAARDAGMAAVTADPRAQSGPSASPFDARRMIFGGFEVVVEV